MCLAVRFIWMAVGEEERRREVGSVERCTTGRSPDQFTRKWRMASECNKQNIAGQCNLDRIVFAKRQSDSRRGHALEVLKFKLDQEGKNGD